MNSGINNPSHPSILYYDSDYPSMQYSNYPENYDEVVVDQGIVGDLEMYERLIRQHGNKVLELCCGTGRISIPLVMEGNNVTAVDLSDPLLEQFKNKIKNITGFPHQNLKILKHDITTLDLDDHNFDVAICAFNSLLCIPDFNLQQQALFRAAAHLKQNGLLALDIWNPLGINLWGDEKPEPFFTRKNPHNGNLYTRFAATGPMDIGQVQTVYGWYDEILEDGKVKRSSYELKWRPLFRYEIQLMLEKAGFRINAIYGGNRNESLTSQSLKMFIEAIKL
jgi:ubiquinone/menaquinone biosynthesis C-methylase UbiE